MHFALADFSKYIEYLDSFQGNADEIALIKKKFQRLSTFDQNDLPDCDLEKVVGVLDIAIDNLNVYSTTILAILSIFCPDKSGSVESDKIRKIKEGYQKIINPPFKVLAKNTVQYLDYILATAGDLRAVLIAIAENVYTLEKLDTDSVRR